MCRGILSVILSALLVLPVHGAQEPTPTVQEQVGQIATGSIVEVKSRTKGAKKVRGRLGQVTTDGFEVQVAQGTKMDSVQLKFADVKSVAEKPQEKGSHPAVLILAGIGAGLLIIIAISAILLRGS
jgi:hypothetical protein